MVQSEYGDGYSVNGHPTRFIRTSDSVLIHYGLDHTESTVGPGSGRYEWGSGERPFQHGGKYPIYDWENSMKARGVPYTAKEEAQALGYESTTELKKEKHLEYVRRRAELQARVQELEDKGVSRPQIAKQLGLAGESTVRSLLNAESKRRNSKTGEVIDFLKKELDERDVMGLDVGKGAANLIGVSEDRLKSALAALEKEGYIVQKHKLKQQGTGESTTMLVLSKPGDETDTYWMVEKNKTKIGILNDSSSDNLEDNLSKFRRNNFDYKKFKNIDSKRVMVRYGDEGGKEFDGCIELRPGAEGLSLGADRYAQVRIGVDGTHYLKGMAVYGDPKDFPDGVDIIYNSNKKSGTPLMGFKDDGTPSKTDKDGRECVFKPQDTDPEAENPFGSEIKAGGQKGYLNIVNYQGDWDDWSRALSSQFLSKQPVKLVKTQLDKKAKSRQDQFEELKSLTNPVVQKILLNKFADKCDSDAEDLKAAPITGQSQSVLIPIRSLKNNECYTTRYPPGTELVLIRHPHAGQFEIPTVTVTQSNREAKRILGNDSPDAIGVNSTVAQILSGADFDGDSVVVIPNNDRKVKTKPILEDLKDFDTQEAYPAYPGMKRVGDKDGFQKQNEMGKVTNLINDMSIKGANLKEITRAVKYSMVVIDAEKHNLDWKRCRDEMGIRALSANYQGVGKNGQQKGASTIVSRAKGDTYVDWYDKSRYSINDKGEKVYAPVKVKDQYKIDDINKSTGKKYTRLLKADEVDLVTKDLVFNSSGEAKLDQILPDGTVRKIYKRRLKSTNMAETKDAMDLVSDKNNPKRVEVLYAEYANSMKQLANQARLAAANLETYKRSPAAREMYKEEVESLNAKASQVLSGKSYERKAQALAGYQVSRQIEANPDLRNNRDGLKKLRRRSINSARAVFYPTGRPKYDITDKEWEAVQARAISPTRLELILGTMDDEMLKKRAMPRNDRTLSNATLTRIKNLLASGISAQEVAERIGVSVSTVYKVART